MADNIASRFWNDTTTRAGMIGRSVVNKIPLAPDIVYPAKVFAESKMQVGVFSVSRQGAMDFPDATPIHDQMTNNFANVANMWQAESRTLQVQMEKLGKNVTPAMLIKAQNCQFMYNQCFEGASNCQKKKEQCMSAITQNFR
jgi:hypothetical protein